MLGDSGKRGLSQVVTTVIIILVVLAAIVLIWAAVRPTIQSAAERVTADCFTIELQAVSCTPASDEVAVSMSAGEGDLTEITFVIDQAGGDTVTESVAMEGVNELKPLESKTYTLSQDLSAGDSVNVAAVVGQGNICPVSALAPAAC